jgi:hypothetical protein
MSLSHLFVILLIFVNISSFHIHSSFDKLSINVSNFEKTVIALLNFIASIAVKESWIDVIDSLSEIT